MHSESSTAEIPKPGAVPREIVRTLRRLCLLHELESDAAAIMAEERRLEHLLAVARAEGATALPAAQVEAVRRREQERAADAAAMSELLAPLLQERLDACLRVTPRDPALRAARAAAAPRIERPGVPLPIADLIDGMLAQEPGTAAPRP